MELARQIELAPKNGDFVVLQDERSGSWEVGRWAPERSSWVQIDGKPVRIFPTHWVPVSGGTAGSENGEGRHQKIADPCLEPLHTLLGRARTQIPFPVLSFPVPPIPVMEPSPKRLRIPSILAFALAPIFIAGYAAFDFGERDGAGVFASNLAAARGEIALHIGRGDAVQAAALEAKRIADAKQRELKQALDESEAKAEALARELDELMAATPAFSGSGSARIAAAPDDPVIERVRPPAQLPQSQSTNAISSADEARVLARAESLIKLSDFSGARLLLEHALDKGSARAAFMMAETYDWPMLRSLQAYGVRGDTEKARQLYELAAIAGIENARERMEALTPSSNP
jgi:hypothetical protein